jgi:hypothetical protein
LEEEESILIEEDKSIQIVEGKIYIDKGIQKYPNGARRKYPDRGS